MKKGKNLGEGEQLMLLAVWRLGEAAHGAAIQRELQERAGRSLTISAIYVTLMRLEQKGHVATGLGAPDSMRGGKARRFFDIKASGILALKASRRSMDQMWDGMGGTVGA